MLLDEMVKIITDSTGIGKTTAENVIKKYNEFKTMTIPKRKRAKKSFLDNRF